MALDTTVTAARQWWTQWLGANADAAGQVRPRPSTEAVPPGWRTLDLELDSFGSRLVATVLRPPRTGTSPEAVVVVPFYEVATVFGRPCARTAGKVSADDQAYAWQLSGAGLSVVVVPWWFEAVAATDPATSGAATLGERYGPVARRHRQHHAATGLGRSVGDLRLVVDYVAEQPWVDPARIGVFGHSLGGKLALHLAALDTRVSAAVAHEPGLGLAHSNWSEPWYLDGRLPPGRDQDELLALVAPRPFLLCGGASDGEHNRRLAERAGQAWGDDGGLDLLYHNGGHPMPPHVNAAAVRWLADRLYQS